MEEVKEKVKKQVKEKIECIIENGIQMDNLDALGKLVDIHKDLSNEDYWNVKKEVYKMRYDEYEDYGRRGVPGSGRGRYRGNYVRRGMPRSGRGGYRGHDRIDEMYDLYNDYNESYEEMNRGNYGAENGMVKSVDGIMKNIYEIVEELSEADSPEVMHIIKKYTQKINEME